MSQFYRTGTNNPRRTCTVLVKSAENVVHTLNARRTIRLLTFARSTATAPSNAVSGLNNAKTLAWSIVQAITTSLNKVINHGTF